MKQLNTPFLVDSVRSFFFWKDHLDFYYHQNPKILNSSLFPLFVLAVTFHKWDLSMLLIYLVSWSSSILIFIHSLAAYFAAFKLSESCMMLHVCSTSPGPCIQSSTSKLQAIYCCHKHSWNFIDCWRCCVRGLNHLIKMYLDDNI